MFLKLCVCLCLFVVLNVYGQLITEAKTQGAVSHSPKSSSANKASGKASQKNAVKGSQKGKEGGSVKASQKGKGKSAQPKTKTKPTKPTKPKDAPKQPKSPKQLKGKQPKAAPACVPKTACPVGLNCGTIDNGCGVQIPCGSSGGQCTVAGETCGGGVPNVCSPCVPTIGCPAGADCGTIDNGCGVQIPCPPESDPIEGGLCLVDGEACGVVTPNVCDCAPTVDCPFGSNCGTIDNGCNVLIPCPPGSSLPDGGLCTGVETCGGIAGFPNVCGDENCVPNTNTCPIGANCGTIDNDCVEIMCSDTLDCPPPQTCGSNICGPCTPVQFGGACSADTDCCGGTCKGGTCCIDGGGACADDGACCSKDCKGGKCAGCGQHGKHALCESDADCCSKKDCGKDFPGQC